MTHLLIDILTICSLLVGMFFMVVAAIGLIRLPDFYNRLHAATMGVSMGIGGLLVAGMLALSIHPDASPVAIIARSLLVILFQFVANPVGTHLLAKAAHLDRAKIWAGTLSDALSEDQTRTAEQRPRQGDESGPK